MPRQYRRDFTDTSTLQEFIDSGASKPISHYNFSILQKSDDMEYPVDNILYNYLTELNTQINTLVLSDLEMLRYHMRPDLLAYDIYGSIEYEFIILALNQMVGPKDFTRQKINFIKPDTLSTLINDIINAETNYMKINRNSYEANELDV